MIKKIKTYFALTEEGMRNTLHAAFYSFLKFFTFILPVVLVFMFLNDFKNGVLKSLTMYMFALTVMMIAIYYILKKEYIATYDTTYKESVALRKNIANTFQKLPLAYFSKHNLSDLSQTIMMDVNNMEMVISHALPQGIGFFFFFIIISFGLILTQPLMGLAVVVPIWFTILLVVLTGKIQTMGIRKYYDTLLKNAASFQEAFELQQEIKSYSMQESIQKEVFHKLEESERIHIKGEFTMAFMSFVFGLLPYLAPVITAILGAVLFSKGEIDVLYYIGYLMSATTISSQYVAVNEYILMMLYFEDSFKRLRNIAKETIQEGNDYALNQFDIEVNHVGFAYKDHKVIDDVSFKANQGEVVALVGPSGCGKTTLLRLISRLYDYQEGSIRIGNYDVKEISTKTLFEHISIVFQNVELFNQSILENIRIGRQNATDEEVLVAAKLANVDCFAKKLPDGYHTMIGENGSKLSGGQRQRISIARAFLKNAPIILLDEISSSLDVENEIEIQASINQLIKDKTVIVITHRLKSIEDVDKIVVLNQGRVDSIGTHKELLKTSKLYQNLVKKSELTDQYQY